MQDKEFIDKCLSDAATLISAARTKLGGDSIVESIFTEERVKELYPFATWVKGGEPFQGRRETLSILDEAGNPVKMSRAEWRKKYGAIRLDFYAIFKRLFKVSDGEVYLTIGKARDALKQSSDATVRQLVDKYFLTSNNHPKRGWQSFIAFLDSLAIDRAYVTDEQNRTQKAWYGITLINNPSE